MKKKTLLVLMAGMLARTVLAESVYNPVEELFRARRFEEAESIAKELLPGVSGRDKCMVLRYLGRSLRAQKHYEEAMEVFEALGRVEGAPAWFYWESIEGRAFTLSRSGNIDEAVLLVRREIDVLGKNHKIAALRLLANKLVKKSGIVENEKRKADLYGQAQGIRIETVKKIVPNQWAVNQQIEILESELDFDWIKENNGLTREEFLETIHLYQWIPKEIFSEPRHRSSRGATNNSDLELTLAF